VGPGTAGRRHGARGAGLLLALAASAWPQGEEPKATATAAKTEVTVGETFAVEVRATGPAGTTFTFPGEAVRETFELRTPAAPGTPAPGGASPPPPDTHRYEAIVFALGEAEVPAIPVRYRLPDGALGEVETEPIPLKVVSLLPRDQDEQKLADIRGPVGVGIGRAFWLGLAGVALLGAAAAAWLWSRRGRKEPAAVPPTPPLSPDEEALRAMDALVASGRLARGEYRPFYIDLTVIAKRYLERRLEAPILEMTTAEMLAHLRSNPQGGLDLVAPLRDLAGAADRIKFARGAGLHDEAVRHLAGVRGLVRDLEARRRPAAPEGGQAA